MLFSSQAGVGIQVWIRKQQWQIQAQSHDGELRAWNSHCCEIPVLWDSHFFEVPIALDFPLLWDSHCFKITIPLKFLLFWDSHCFGIHIPLRFPFQKGAHLSGLQQQNLPSLCLSFPWECAITLLGCLLSFPKYWLKSHQRNCCVWNVPDRSTVHRTLNFL